MKKSLILFLLVLSGRLVLGQAILPEKIRPQRPGTFMPHDSVSYLKRVDYLGNETYFKIDTSAIQGWTAKLNTYRRNLAITGDISIPASGTTATLPTVNSQVGTFGGASTLVAPTFDAKGRVTSVATYGLILQNVSGAPDSLAAHNSRFSAINLTVAAKSGYLTQSGLRASTASGNAFASVIHLTDKDKTGTFVYDPNDSSTPDNAGTVLVDASGRRFKRAYTGMIEAEWFGAKGYPMLPTSTTNTATNTANAATNAARITANTTAIQAACDWAAYNAGTLSDQTLYPTNKDRPAIVHIPAGTYYVNQIGVKGAIHIVGDGGMSFGGTVLVSAPGGTTNIFDIQGAPETAQSSAAEIEGIRFLLSNGTTDQSCIYSDNAANTYKNSLHVTRCWFQLAGGNQHAYRGLRSDDLVFAACNFDGSAYAAALVLGGTGTTDVISNAAIYNCTINDQRNGFAILINVDGLLVIGNRFYAAPALTRPGSVFDAAESYAVAVKNLQINNNQFRHVNGIVQTKFSGLQFNDNRVSDATSRVLDFELVGGTISNVQAKDNHIRGHWATDNDSPFYAAGTTILSNSEFDNNITDSLSSSSTAYYLPYQGFVNSIWKRHVLGFSTITNAPASSIIDNGNYSVSNIGSLTVTNAVLTGALSLTPGSFSSPVLAFAGTATGFYKESAGEFAIRGPAATAGQSVLITSNGQTNLAINGYGSTDPAYVVWQKGRTDIFYAGVDASGNWNLYRSGMGTPRLTISSAGDATLNGNTTLPGSTTVNNLNVTGTFNVPSGSYSTPGMTFFGTATGIFKDSDGSATWRGLPSTSGYAFRVTSSAGTALAINGNSSTDVPGLFWQQNYTNVFYATVDGSQNWNLYRAGNATPRVAISNAGDVTLNGNTTIAGTITLPATFLTPSYTNTITATSGWTSSTYNDLMPESTLQAGHTYLLQIRIIKSGTDQSTTAYVLPMELGWSGYGTHSDLTPSNPNYYASATRGIKVRWKTTTGNNTPGLEGTIVDSSMQGCTLTLKVIPQI